MSGADFAKLFAYITEIFTSIGTWLKDTFSQGPWHKNFSIVLVLFICVLQFVFIILSVVFLVFLSNSYSRQLLIKNPLNRDRVEYNVLSACSFDLKKVNLRFAYIVFPIIIIFTTLSLIAIFAYNTYLKFATQYAWFDYPAIIFVMLFCVFIQNTILLVGAYTTFQSTKRKLDKQLQRFNDFNVFISKSLADQNVKSILNEFDGTDKNIVEESKKILNVLSTINDNTTSDDIVRIFFTLNIYRYLLNLGFDSDNSTAANNAMFSQGSTLLGMLTKTMKTDGLSIDMSKQDKLFKDLKKDVASLRTSPAPAPSPASATANICSLAPPLTYSTVSMSDYLYYGVTSSISDYSIKYLEIMTKNGIVLNYDAISIREKVACLTSEANKLMTECNPDDAFGSFLQMALFMPIVSILSPILIVSAYKMYLKYNTPAPTSILSPSPQPSPPQQPSQSLQPLSKNVEMVIDALLSKLFSTYFTDQLERAEAKNLPGLSDLSRLEKRFFRVVFSADKCESNPICEEISREILNDIEKNLKDIETQLKNKNKAIENSPPFRKNVFYQLIEKFMDQYRKALSQYDTKNPDKDSIVHKIIKII